MTSEQVAELRKMLRTREKYGTDPWPRMWDLVPRLLDEREALLEALHGAFDALEIAGEGRFHQDALRAAGDAIKAAESP